MKKFRDINFTWFFVILVLSFTFIIASIGNRRVFEIMLDEFGKPLLYQGDL